jgi:hypothetical protein
MPAPLPGAILPARRIVAYYGNPHSKRMGVLGEYPLEQMLVKLDAETRKWNAADPSRPVQPALHLIAVVAQGAAGTDGKWRRRESAAMIEKVHGWARQKNALLFLDVQIGKSTLEEELQVLLPYLSRPDVHLGIDPEFAMTKGGDPGRRVGSYDARHINQAIDVLGELVDAAQAAAEGARGAPLHRADGHEHRQIRSIPRVQVVMHMDGLGAAVRQARHVVALHPSVPGAVHGLQAVLPQRHEGRAPADAAADVLALQAGTRCTSSTSERARLRRQYAGSVAGGSVTGSRARRAEAAGAGRAVRALDARAPAARVRGAPRRAPLGQHDLDVAPRRGARLAPPAVLVPRARAPRPGVRRKKGAVVRRTPTPAAHARHLPRRTRPARGEDLPRRGLRAARAARHVPAGLRRAGVLWVHGAFEPATGQAALVFSEHRDSASHIRLLEHVLRAFPSERWLLIEDDLSAHPSRDTRAALVAWPEITLQLLPKYAAWPT